MAMRQAIEAYELLDSARVTGQAVADLLRARVRAGVEVECLEGPRGHTDVIRVVIAGTDGRAGGGTAPTLGIIGQLGGIGARPHQQGLVSDADGAISAVACALKLLDMQAAGDALPGDVLMATHICPDAPVQARKPVPMMSSPVEIHDVLDRTVDPAMDAIISIDTTRGNRVLNRRGIAITPTVKEGYILRVSEDLLDVVEWVTGRPPVVLPITTQDITPYGNGIFHLNSLMQPCTVTAAPVVGLALTAEVPVPGSATGASQVVDIEQAVRFCVEAAKAFTAGRCRFYNEEEYGRLVALYGSLRQLQTLGMEAR
ncbi:MAG: DUF1177 domain-containing protein [Armatimonadetes bacterium]|nr:DUF1177 domain-containing protein [Armatimonadota bacterium]